IEGSRTHFLFMLQKSKILAEIELFLLLPNQRRWQQWFPDVILYDMPIEDVQQRINEIDDNPGLYNSPHISHELRRLAEMKVKEDPITKTECNDLVKELKEEIFNTILNKNVAEVSYENKPENEIMKDEILSDKNDGEVCKENKSENVIVEDDEDDIRVLSDENVVGEVCEEKYQKI
ncbi:7008_t:CDS:2, partial [Funneliformis geosporum]